MENNIQRIQNKYSKRKSGIRVVSDVFIFLPISIVVASLLIIVFAFGLPTSIKMIKEAVTNDQSVQLRGAAEQVVFVDIPNDSEYAESLKYFKSRGIVKGYADGSFKPNNTVNRAEMVKALVKAKRTFPLAINYHSCFEDVNNEWFAPEVCYAFEQKWVGGFGDGTFRPNESISRAGFIKILLSAYDINVDTNNQNQIFEDVPADTWYGAYVNRAYQLGILQEDPEIDFFEPNKNISRGDAFKIFYNLVKTLE